MNYANRSIEKIHRENKLSVLLGDFNIDLLKYQTHSSTDELIKVSANPKLTVFHNFGFLYVSIHLGSSFHLKEIPQKKCFSYGKLLSENYFAVLIILISEILFFLVSRNQNLGEMCMHFELQVGSPRINLAEIWSNCCQIAHLQNRVCEF